MVSLIAKNLKSMIVDTMKVYYLFSKQVNWCQGDGFSSVGARTGVIKLAMTGTQDWWCRFSPLLG